MMFKYLAIGNSITKHGICSYWWNNCGMSASLQANDYFHIVKRYIASKYKIGKDINAYNFNIWEVQSLDRDETLFFLDEFLDCEMCLVTIQLGENVIDVTTYEYDFISLVNYIKKRCPQCKVFIIGDFWYSKDRGEIKKNIAKECNAIYISLSDI